MPLRSCPYDLFSNAKSDIWLNGFTIAKELEESEERSIHSMMWTSNGQFTRILQLLWRDVKIRNEFCSLLCMGVGLGTSH